jgi:hypothetical protein
MVKFIKRRGFKVFILAIVLITLSVTLFNIFNNGKDIKNSQDFIKALKSKGYNSEAIEVSKNKPEFFASYKSHKVIKINDRPYINYYEFETEDLSKTASETISKDARKIGNLNVCWNTAVKFYKKGNIIVQYTGTDFKTLWHLRLIMGKSIASNEVEFLLYKKFISKN